MARTTRAVVAIKAAKNTRERLSSIQELFREVNSMRMLNHPNIVKLLEVTESEETLIIVMECTSVGETCSPTWKPKARSAHTTR